MSDWKVAQLAGVQLATNGSFLAFDYLVSLGADFALMIMTDLEMDENCRSQNCSL